MEDWEEFFLEKSIRRRDKVLRREKAQTLQYVIGGTLLLAVIVLVLYLVP